MSLAHNERVKLTATYLNTGAGAFFAAGVAPLAAVTFGFTGSAAAVSTLTFGQGVARFFVASLALYAAARYCLRSLKP